MIAQPIIQPSTDGLYKLVKNYTILTPSGKTITARAGFLFDGNSTIISRFDPHWLTAALIHDWIYRTPRYDDGTPIGRLEADQLYYMILKSLGVWSWTRKLFFAGVRLFGWHAWNKYRKQ